MNLFNKNSNSSTGNNLFNNINRPPTNPFANNQQQQAQNNQNLQNQPIIPPNPSNTSASKPIPSGPRIQSSLNEKHSFTDIYERVAAKSDLTKSELDFLTRKGQRIFEQDEWKDHHFINVIYKQANMGYGHDVTLFPGQVQNCNEIKDIWCKIVKHFAHIAQTNFMNGYFLLKKVLIEGRYYQNLYRPKSGLSNRVFEPNAQAIKCFYVPLTNKQTVNIHYPTYIEILQKLIDAYYMEYLSFIKIIENVSLRNQRTYQSLDSASNQKPKQISNKQPGQNQPEPRDQKLVFEDLLKQNIMKQLWKMYKLFAVSKCPKPGTKNFKEDDPSAHKWASLKRHLFRNISHTMTDIIKTRYTQEMLIANQPIPLLEAINFITMDISTVVMESIDLASEPAYVKAGLDLILAVIPFASFIRDDSFLCTYFNYPSQKNKFMIARQNRTRHDLMTKLSQIKIPEFRPIVVLAKLEIKRIQLQNQPLPGIAQKKEARIQQVLDTWESQFYDHPTLFEVFEDDKWKNWVALFVENLTIQAVIQNQIIRRIIIHYCKRVVKGRSAKFFLFWKRIFEFKMTEEFRELMTNLDSMPQNPTMEQRRKQSYSLPPWILKNIDLYTVGLFLSEIIESNNMNEALKVFTTLIKRRKDEEEVSANYTKQLQQFMQKYEYQEEVENVLFSTVVISLSSMFDICCKKKGLDNQIQDYSKVQQDRSLVEDYGLEMEVKFFCELVIQNRMQLETLEIEFFDSRNHLATTGDVPGIRICYFLCRILERVMPNPFNFNLLRYLIRAIDHLFCFKGTRKLILCALSAVFPYEQLEHEYYNQQYRSFDKNGQAKPSRKAAFNVIELLLQYQNDSFYQKQVKKLRKTVSYHFNNMVKSCDSIDEYFTVSREYNQPELYSRIDDELNNWKFTQISTFLKNRQRRFRGFDWFYTFARVLQFGDLLAIDIDSIIEIMRKMRIPIGEDFVSLGPMRSLLNIINEGKVLDQMLAILKPIGCENKDSSMIVNEKLYFYKAEQIKKEETEDLRMYNKYRNKTVVEYKTVQLVKNQQQQILRTICLFARLIEEVLRFLLDQYGFQTYFLIQNLNFVKQLIPKLINPEEIHRFEGASENHFGSDTKINIIASLVSLLNLYNYKCKFPQKMTVINQIRLPILHHIEMASQNNLAVEEKWTANKFSFKIMIENSNFYTAYDKDMRLISEKYFESVLYEMTDFSFENNETSLRSTIFSIFQLLIDCKCGHVLGQAITNYSYPIKVTGGLTDYSLTNKYLKKNDYKNLTPLLFDHINQTLNHLNPQSPFGSQSLIHIVRLIQSLSAYVMEPILTNQVVESLPSIRKCIINLITSEEIYKDNRYGDRKTKDQQSFQYSKAQQINVLNKIALFVYRLVETVKGTISEEEYSEKIIKNFLVNPQNILKMLFNRMTGLSQYFKRENLPLLETASDHLANFLMQSYFTRNALYCATYDIILKTFFSVHEFLEKNQVTEIISYLIFHNSQIITRKPFELKNYPEIIWKLSLTPNEAISQNYIIDPTIPTIFFSQKVAFFFHCNRMNFKKYGPNFMYNTNLAFHRIKTLYREDQQTVQTVKLKVRKEVFLIQLINCMQSLYFSYRSMTKTFFQLMLYLSNIGSVGQNLSLPHLDKSIPKPFEQALIQNKYCLKNKFSFVECILFLKSMTTIVNEDSILMKFVIIMNEFLGIVQQEMENHLTLFDEIKERERMRESKTQERGISRNVIYAGRVFLEAKPIRQVDQNSVIRFVTNISNALKEYFSDKQLTQSVAIKYTHFLDYFLHILTRIPLSLNVILQSFSSILSQYQKIIKISTLAINQKKISDKASFCRNESLYDNKTVEKWLSDIDMNKLEAQQIVISTCKNLLREYYENHRHRNYFPSEQRNEHLSQNGNPPFLGITKQELEKNINLICAIASKVSKAVHRNSMFIMDQKVQKENYIHTAVHYTIKLLMQNIKSYDSITRITLFKLCNKFCQMNESVQVTQWGFHSEQFEISKRILLKEVLEKEHPAEGLERIIALESFVVFSSVNEKDTVYTEIIPILMNVINFDNNFLIKYQKQNAKDKIQNQRLRINNLQNTKRYNLTVKDKELSLTNLIEYKKLMMAILVSMPPGKWNSKIYPYDVDVLYLDILRFAAVDLQESKIQPLKPVEVRLSQLMVTDQHLSDLVRKGLNFKSNYQAVNSFPINSTNNVPLRNRQIEIQNSYKASNQKLQTASFSSISLWDFICLVHHNELINSYLLAVKTGFESSQIFFQIEGYYFKKTEYMQMWESIEINMNSLFEYFSKWSDIFLDNPHLMSNLIELYNYVGQEPSYQVEFESLTRFFEPLDCNFIRDEIILAIIDYCEVVTVLMKKMREIEEKTQMENRKQRIQLLKKCVRLLEKNKIVNALKELNFYDKVYQSLKDDLQQEINMQSDKKSGDKKLKYT